MVTIKKPKSITITVRDRKSNKSKSITVYDANINEVFNKIKKTLHKLQ